MPSATLQVTLPEQSWIGEVTREYPDAKFRVLAVVSDRGESGVGLLDVATTVPTEIVGMARGHHEIGEVQVLEVTDDRVLFQFETGAPRLMELAKQAGIPVVTPFTIREGIATWDITAGREQLSNLATAFDEAGIQYTVVEVRPEADAHTLLSERQTSLIREAVDRGYYDTPRECTLTELADALGIAKSTCSETLHRAEGRIIKEFAETRLAANRESLTIEDPVID